MPGFVFFSLGKLRLLNLLFLSKVFVPLEKYCCTKLKLKKCITCDFFRKVMAVYGLPNSFGQVRTIIAQYNCH